MINRGIRQFLNTAVLSVVLLCAAFSVYGQGTLLRSDYPESYIVADGDTLWTIAGQFLQDPERWPEIWKPDAYLDNSELIYPGDVLSVANVGGSPRILLQRGDRTTVQLGPQVRELPLTSTIPAIPLQSIESSFTKNRIVTREQYEEAPYIVANVRNNLAIGTGDEVYARGVWPVGTRTFEVYRENVSYWDDSGEELLGLELEYLGFATISEDEEPGLKRMLINNSAKEIKVSDRLLIREESTIGATIFPTEPEMEVEGEIIAIVSGETLASQFDTVVIDLGLDDEIEIGNVLSIERMGPMVTDPVKRERLGFWERWRSTFSEEELQLPGEEVGTILVYKAFEQISYAVILSSLEPAELFNKVVNP